MSKSNIEKVIEETISDKQNLQEFLICKDQNDLYKYCLNKGSGYTREEFVEETIVKANKEKEVVASSLKDVGGSQVSHGISKKIRQAFTKALAAGLAVFSAVPALQSLMSEVEATSVSETVKKIDDTDIEKSTSRNNKKSNFEGKESNNQKSGFGYVGKTLVAALVIANAIQFLLGEKSKEEKDEAIFQKDIAITQRDTAESQIDAAISQKNIAESRINEFISQINAVISQKNIAESQIDQARRERDQARRERDQARRGKKYSRKSKK